jgi:hypothetical protein
MTGGLLFLNSTCMLLLILLELLVSLKESAALPHYQKQWKKSVGLVGKEEWGGAFEKSTSPTVTDNN